MFASGCRKLSLFILLALVVKSISDSWLSAAKTAPSNDLAWSAVKLLQVAQLPADKIEEHGCNKTLEDKLLLLAKDGCHQARLVFASRLGRLPGRCFSLTFNNECF